ncbi:MAG: AAA family ATPase [Janthinobacterium lividum]
MAIFHASMRMLSRSDRNTVKAIAYRTGTDLYDEKSGKWFYYSSKDVAHVELLLPDNAPQWAKDLKLKIAQDRTAGVQEFSNLAERAEKRKDSQVYREFEFALPKELTNEQNIKLANEFLQDQACQLGMVALPSFHFDTDEETGEGRPHCHAIFLTRELEERGLCAKKELSWNQKEINSTWREQLAAYANFYLKMYGHEARVDHRSYEAQGIDILPQPKLGRGAKVRDGRERSDDIKRGRDQFETQRQRNVAKIIENPSVVLDIVTRQYSTFMWGDVEKVLARYVKEEDIYLSVHEKLKNSAELVLLKEGKSKEATAETLETEHSIKNTDRAENSKTNSKDRQPGEEANRSDYKDTARSENIDGIKDTQTTRNNEQLGKFGKEPKVETTLQHTTSSLDFSNILNDSSFSNTSNKLDILATISTTSIYTTRSMIKSELSLVRLAEKMGSHQSHGTSIHKVDQAIKTTNEKMAVLGHQLSPDQVLALRHVTKGDQLSCVIGYAGSGKSTMFKTATQAWQTSGYKVYGLAPTGRAAQNLEEIGIKSQTLHKFLKDYQEGRSRYNAKSVLILDEAGMVDVRRFNELLSAADHLGVKLVISGDGAQAQPIEAGPAFRLVTDRLGVQKMDTIIRQQVDWQREATRLFGTYETKEALNLYLDKGHIQFIGEKVDTLDKLVAKDQHREVITLYNLSRRVSGNMWHIITEDLKQHEVGSKEFTRGVFNHFDFEEFKHWQGVRQSAASEMISNIDTYRPLMKQQGVDPVAFAANFISKEVSEEHRHSQIQHLIKGWKLETPDEGQALHVCDLRQETRKELIQAWSQSQKDHAEKSHLMLTYTNKDTSRLNDEARSLMRLAGRLAVEEHIHTIKRENLDDFGRTITRTERKAFAVGERLVFTRNDKSLDVKNGTLGTIIEMNGDKLKVKIDKTKSDDKDQIVSFSTNLNPYIDQGWAITIIKSQGSTADRVFKLATHEQDRNLAYVGMTRHKEFLQVFGSKLDFWREEIFTKRLSQSREKLSSLDYLSKEEARAHIRPPERLTDALNSLGNKLESWGYTSRKSWENLTARFIGQKIIDKDWTPHVSQTIDETIRAREMMSINPEGMSSAHTQGAQSTASNSQAGRGSSSTYGSGRDNSSSSSSVIITDSISDFINKQADIDAARNMKDKTSDQVDSVSQAVASSTQNDQEKDVQVGNNKLKESVDDILTNSVNDKVETNNIFENIVPHRHQQQTSQLSEDQERHNVNDQKIVVQDSQSLDKAGPAPLTSVPNSEQEPATRASGLESGRSTIETSQEVKQIFSSAKEMSKDISRFLDLTNTVKQISVLNNPEASKKIFAELESIAKDWSQRPEFMDQIEASENKTAIKLANDYAKEFQPPPQRVTIGQAFQEMTVQQHVKLEEDTNRFLDLTNTVKQISVLNNPEASKKIFAELESIAKDWSQQPEFMDQIEASENKTAIKLANDYAKEFQPPPQMVTIGQAFQEMTVQQHVKLEEDTNRFLDLTNTVKQISVLNNPEASKKIFAELESIAKDWSQRPEFIDQIRQSENSSAIRLAQSYVKEHTSIKQQMQSYELER